MRVTQTSDRNLDFAVMVSHCTLGDIQSAAHVAMVRKCWASSSACLEPSRIDDDGSATDLFKDRDAAVRKVDSVDESLNGRFDGHGERHD